MLYRFFFNPTVEQKVTDEKHVVRKFVSLGGIPVCVWGGGCRADIIELVVSVPERPRHPL
jgi:hypothetical protein